MDNTQEQQVESTPKKKKRGRPRNENFLPWEKAREFIREELIPSRGKYFEWWDRNKPKALPRFPYRVYKEWTSWNDFLGTNNKFNEKINRSWRPLEEATLWVHKQQIETQTKWMEFCREGNLPEDIPARPDLVYDGWRSWNHWLGNKPIQAVEAKQEAARVSVFYIIKEQGVPENVFTIGIESGGISALKERWNREQFDVFKLFWHDPTKIATVQQIVNALSRPYLTNDRQRIFPNINEAIWYIQIHLETIPVSRRAPKEQEQDWSYSFGTIEG